MKDVPCSGTPITKEVEQDRYHRFAKELHTYYKLVSNRKLKTKKNPRTYELTQNNLFNRTRKHNEV